MRILVIDDDHDVREVIRLMLEGAGHQVVTADDGRKGLQAFVDGGFDIVATDIIMPEKEGIETIRAIRKIDQAVRIVAISGGGRLSVHDVLGAARALGADAAVAKPFSRDELFAAMEIRAVA